MIGDTPRDIACARADDVRVVAVATGPFAIEALADADAVVDDARALLPVLEDFASARLTTAALPPPRRIGSAAARKPCRGRGTRSRSPRRSRPRDQPNGLWPCVGAISAPPPASSMNAGSASLATALRCDTPRRGDRLRQGVAEVEPLDQDLQHRRDDRRAAGRAERQHRLAVAR